MLKLTEAELKIALKASEMIREKQQFSHKEVMEESGMAGMGEPKWARIRAYIQENESTFLYPVTGEYFKRKGLRTTIDAIRLYVTSARGRQPRGWISMSDRNRSIIEYYLKNRRNQVIGQRRSHNEHVNEAGETLAMSEGGSIRDEISELAIDRRQEMPRVAALLSS